MRGASREAPRGNRVLGPGRVQLCAQVLYLAPEVLALLGQEVDVRLLRRGVAERPVPLGLASGDPVRGVLGLGEPPPELGRLVRARVALAGKLVCGYSLATAPPRSVSSPTLQPQAVRSK